MVKENGKLIYVTCSILRQENQDQVEAFLKTEIGQGFELDKEEIISRQLNTARCRLPQCCARRGTARPA